MAPPAPDRRVAIHRALIIAVLLASISALPSGTAAASGDAAGFVKNSSGTAVVIRGGETFPAVPGTSLLVGDALSTGPDGSLGAIFRDDSTVSLGPDSNLVVRDFRFDPERGNIGMLLRITRGSLAFLSGLIGKLSPESARFETPLATIGIRGTRFAVKVGEPVPQ